MKSSNSISGRGRRPFRIAGALIAGLLGLHLSVFIAVVMLSDGFSRIEMGITCVSVVVTGAGLGYLAPGLKVRIRYSLRALIILVGLFSICLAVPYWIPKSQPLTCHKSYVGYYRGLGLTHDSGYFGRNWYRIVVNEGPEGYWEVDVSGLGYAPYRGYYPTGTLREQGVCLVEKAGDEIAPDRHNIQDAQYFDPSGSLISEVKNGTGKQVLCLTNGQPHWELELKEGIRVHVKTWYRDGRPAYDLHYRHGVPHGASVSYHSNGAVHRCGEYANGDKVGSWKCYTAEGELESERDYGSYEGAE